MKTRETTMTKQKILLKEILEWVKQLDSHLIYSHDELAEDFKRITGQEPVWEYYFAYEAGNGYDRRSAYLNDNIDINEKLISGFDVAEAIAHKYASQTKSIKILGELSGRGSRHRMAIQALEEAISKAGE